jgi:hypothetical protein
LQKYIPEGIGNINESNAVINKDRRIGRADLFALRKGVSDAQTNLDNQKLL